MTVTGLIKLTQGAHTDVPGNAVFGTRTDGPVAYQKDPASTGTNFTWVMVDVPPGSAIPTGVLGTASSGTFPQPDANGCYLLQLTEDDGVTTVVTRLCLGVKDPSGRLRPSFKATDKAMTFGGQSRGWAKYMEEWFSAIDSSLAPRSLSGVFTVDAAAPAGGNGSDEAPFQDLQSAVNAAGAGSATIKVAPGTYPGNIVFPAGQLFVIQSLSTPRFGLLVVISGNVSVPVTTNTQWVDLEITGNVTTTGSTSSGHYFLLYRSVLTGAFTSGFLSFYAVSDLNVTGGSFNQAWVLGAVNTTGAVVLKRARVDANITCRNILAKGTEFATAFTLTTSGAPFANAAAFDEGCSFTAGWTYTGDVNKSLVLVDSVSSANYQLNKPTITNTTNVLLGWDPGPPQRAEFIIDPLYTGSLQTGAPGSPFTSLTAAIAASPSTGAHLVLVNGANTTENPVLPGTGSWTISCESTVLGVARATITGNLSLGTSSTQLQCALRNVAVTGNVSGTTSFTGSFFICQNSSIGGTTTLNGTGSGFWWLVPKGDGRSFFGFGGSFTDAVSGVVEVQASNYFFGSTLQVASVSAIHGCQVTGALTLAAGASVDIFNTVLATPTINGSGTVNIDGWSYARSGTISTPGGAVITLRNFVDFPTVNTALATANASINVNSQKITSLLDPQNPQDAATKNYVDALAQGLDVKPSVTAYSTTNIASLSGLATTVDGVLLNTDGMRVALGGQTTGSQDGIYVVHSGAWTRSTDMPVGSSAAGAFFFVEQGTVNADNGFVCTNNAGSDVVGTNTLTFTQFSGAGSISAGNGINKTGNVLSVVANPDGSITVTGSGVGVGVLASDAQHGSRGNGSQHTVAVSGGANGFMSGTDKAKIDKFDPTGAVNGDLFTWNSASSKLVPATATDNQVTIGSGSGYVKTVVINVDDDAGTIQTLFDVQDVGASRFNVDLNGKVTAKASFFVNTDGGSLFGVGALDVHAGTDLGTGLGKTTTVTGGQGSNANGGPAWLRGGNVSGTGTRGNAIVGGTPATTPITDFKGMGGGYWVPATDSAPTAAPASGAFFYIDPADGKFKGWRAGAGAPTTLLA